MSPQDSEPEKDKDDAAAPGSSKAKKKKKKKKKVEEGGNAAQVKLRPQTHTHTAMLYFLIDMEILPKTTKVRSEYICINKLFSARCKTGGHSVSLLLSIISIQLKMLHFTCVCVCTHAGAGSHGSPQSPAKTH